MSVCVDCERLAGILDLGRTVVVNALLVALQQVVEIFDELDQVVGVKFLQGQHALDSAMRWNHMSIRSMGRFDHDDIARSCPFVASIAGYCKEVVAEFTEFSFGRKNGRRVTQATDDMGRARNQNDLFNTI